MIEVLIISADGSSRIDYLEPGEADAWRLAGYQVLPTEKPLDDLSIHEVGVNRWQISDGGNQLLMNIVQI